MVPIPLSLLAQSNGSKLTKVEFTLASANGASAGSLEDANGASGGTPLGSVARWTAKTGATVVVTLDLSTLNLKWEDRWKYRLGGVNCYAVWNVKLYMDGVLSQTSFPTINYMPTLGFGISGEYNFWGMNIDIDNRNTTRYGTAGTVASYPK